jgi:Xaa-Pro aminopeptidase
MNFLINKSKGFAYSPIIASGKNSNVLHYIQNNMQCKEGDLITFRCWCRIWKLF